MTDDLVADLAGRINATDSPKAVVYVAGGGTEVFPMLLARGGGSATLLAGRVVYAPEEFRAVLGSDPGKFVDARSARGLAMAAFRHALTIRGGLPPEEVFGVGATSKLASQGAERPGRSHEIHAAVQSSHFTDSWSLTLPIGHDRAWEERINALFLLNVLAARMAGSASVPLEQGGHEVAPGAITYQGEAGDPSTIDVLVGRRPWVALDVPSRQVSGEFVARTIDDRELPRLLLPGSFRPLHAGHVAMAEVASRLTGLRCGYELSLFHPEKPPLDFIAIRSRLEGFAGQHRRIYLTNAPTYVEKARLFPGCTFVVGHDTAHRIVDPQYYGGPSARDAMLEELERLGTRFLVCGRVDASGEFRDFSPEDFDHPVAGFLGRVAVPVPADAFRHDISSTEVRRRSGGEFP